MPYLFPERALRGREPVDPEGLNRDFQPPAEKLTRLDQHDLVHAETRAEAPADGAFYLYYPVIEDQDPSVIAGAGPPPTYRYPQTSSESTAIWNSGDWEPLSAISRTLTTGVSLLWIHGWVHAILQESTNRLALGTNFLSLQLAIRVDGVIYTLTGHDDIGIRHVRPIVGKPQRDLSAATPTPLPGPSGSVDQVTCGVGAWFYPLRVSAMVPVGPGQHSVEIVGKRIPRSLHVVFDWITDPPGHVGIYSHKMIVIDIPMWPSAASTSLSTEIPLIEPEQVLSQALLGTDRAVVLQSAYNNVKSGNLARGALTHAHLPNPFLATGQTWIDVAGTPARRYTNARYPSYTADTIAVNRTGGVVGWWNLDDGAGIRLRTDSANSSHPGAWSVGAPSLFLVLANVHIVTVYDLTFPGPVHDDVQMAGALAIGYQVSGGSPVIIDDTIGFVSNHMAAGIALDNDVDGWKEEIDIALMAIIDDREGVLAGDIDWFGVYGSTFDMSNTAGRDVGMAWRRGHIQVFQLRDDGQ